MPGQGNHLVSPQVSRMEMLQDLKSAGRWDEVAIVENDDPVGLRMQIFSPCVQVRESSTGSCRPAISQSRQDRTVSQASLVDESVPRNRQRVGQENGRVSRVFGLLGERIPGEVVGLGNFRTRSVDDVVVVRRQVKSPSLDHRGSGLVQGRTWM